MSNIANLLPILHNHASQDCNEYNLCNHRKTDFSGAVVLDFLYKRKILRLKPQYDDTFSVILRATPEESVSASVMPKLPPHICNEIPHIFELKQ